ncbi:MAG: ABC transporter permease [Deinococcus sp.]|nr:ABC transporter permease [Deinococcus sp.]
MTAGVETLSQVAVARTRVPAIWRVVRAEFLKALRKRRTWFLVILYFIIGPLLQVLLRGTRALDGVALASNNLNGILGNLWVRLAVLLVVTMVFIEDRPARMWKSVLPIVPWRSQLLFGKVLAGFLLLGVLMLGSGLSSYLVGELVDALTPGQVRFSVRTSLVSLLTAYAGQWAGSIGYLGLCFLGGWLITSPLVAVLILYLLPGLLEQGVNSGLGWYVGRFKPEGFDQVAETIKGLLLTPNMEVGRYLVRISGTNWSAAGHALLVSAGYAVICLGLLWLLFRRADIHN